MDKLTIDAYMTRSPVTVSAGEPLSAAAARMQAEHFRHLPVTADGKLVGILSARDAEVALAVGVGALTVGAVMVTQPFTISSHSSLEWIVMEMAERKCGSVVVVDEEAVVGVFTTTDALHALEQLLGRSRRRRRTPAPQH